MRRIGTPGALGRDARHAAFVAREAGVWNVAAVRCGEVIRPDGPVDARQAADVVASGCRSSRRKRADRPAGWTG